MKHQRILSLAVAFVLGAIFTSGCSGISPELTQPTTSAIPPSGTTIPTNAAPVPAASTTLPATSTTVPLGASTVPATGTTAPTAAASGGSATSLGIFGPAIDKVKQATAYRVEMQITGQGNLGLNAGETPSPDATPLVPVTQTLNLISMKGEVNGQTTHFALQGLLAAFLGIDPSKSLEVATSGDKSFVHGPVALLGANEDKWYELPASESSVAKPPLTPNSFLDSFTSSGLDPNEFTKSGTETLDNHSCDVYAGDKAAVEKTLKTVGQATGAGDISSIDAAEFKFWICDDGFMHQVRMAIQGHAQNQPDQKSAFTMQMHIYDFGSDIKIEVPSNAEILTTPSFANTGTPTP